VRNTGRVSSDDDDEALTWVGGRDPSHYETPEVVPVRRATAAKPGKSAKPAEGSISTPLDDDEDAPTGTSSVVLVVLGILGGVYLLYTIGWFVSWQRFVYVATTPFDQIAFGAQQVLAVLAAPVWFAVTVLLTRDHRPAARLLWLVIGAIVLIPWPFTLGL
jgi:hypothetical protein